MRVSLFVQHKYFGKGIESSYCNGTMLLFLSGSDFSTCIGIHTLGTKNNKFVKNVNFYCLRIFFTTN